MYIEGIYNTVLLKDIEDRLRRKESSGKNSNVTDVALLKSVSKYLSSVIGSPVSLRSITNYMISNERKVSVNTISDYVTALCDAYLYYPVDPMDLNGKEVMKSNKKYYIVDLGLRNYILPKRTYDFGFSLENIVYFELIRRRYEVYVGRHGSHEIDFIAKKDNVYTYIQVTASMVDESTFNREITPLKNIKDNYEKIILTMDEYTPGNYEGIKIINALEWLLSRSD
jgi:predicted AAA+ superfamily ATPase